MRGLLRRQRELDASQRLMPRATMGSPYFGIFAIQSGRRQRAYARQKGRSHGRRRRACAMRARDKLGCFL